MKKLQIYLKTTLGAFLVAALVAAPMVSFAKENNSDKNENKNSKQEVKKKDKNCLKAFGHLIAPGWIKKNGRPSISDDCWLPFGIAKKLHGRNGTTTNATTTPDTTAPVISNISVTMVNSSKADVRWNTDEKTIGAIFFGTTSPVVVNTPATSSTGSLLLGATSTNSTRIFDSAFNKDHKVRINHLNASTTYYVVVVSRDAAGNVSISGVTSFTTAGPSNDAVAPVISNIVFVVGNSSIKVDWKTNEPATSKLFYGTSTINASTSLQINNSTLKTNHSLTATGLGTSTLYHLLLQSADASVNVGSSGEYTVMTSL